jgi:ABC-type transport system substrate-binding protein
MKRSFYVLLSMVVLASMLLAACGAPAATEAPAAEAPAAEAPAATEAPVVEAPAYEGHKLEAPNCDYGGNVKSIEATAEDTVVFSFCQPEPAFIPKVSSVEAFDIYDSDFLTESGGNSAAFNDTPVGTGPYILKEWVRGSYMTFEPNPNYFGEKPANTTFTLKWGAESAARLTDLQAGNTSGIAEVTADDIPLIEADANIKLYPRKVNNFLYIGLNNSKAPFDNEQVRQAFAMAIDKQKIVDDFYAPGSIAATQFVPPAVKPGFTDGYSSPAFDAAKAVEMLTAAGFDFGQTITLSYSVRTRPYFPQPDKIAEAVQAQLVQNLGIKVELEKQEWAEYLPSVRASEKQMFFLGWSEDYPDATNWYDVFLTSSSKSFGTAYPDIEELIIKAGKLGDATERQALYDQINPLIDTHVPAIVLAHGTTQLAFGAGVENVVLGPYNENFPQMNTADGNVIFSQDGEPVSLMCADETDGSSFRACNQLYSKLYAFDWGTATPKPDLAEECTGNEDATVWTCVLKKGVVFSNGATLDANDVVDTFSIGLDWNNPLRVGNSGTFQYFLDLLGPKGINQPAE